MNFDTFGNAMLTLFNLLLVNNWFYIMDAHVEASHTHWAALFFISYYIFMVLIVLNVATSYIIEAHMIVSNVEPDEDEYVPAGEEIWN